MESVNNDIIYNIKNENIDSFYLWNLKNNLICIKINDNNYLFNYNLIKILFNYEEKKIYNKYFDCKKKQK